MRKIISLFLLCIVVVSGFAGNYILTINGESFEIDMEKEKSIEMNDGKVLNILIKQKDVLTYETENYSFDHLSRLTPSSTDLGNGISQAMMISPLGTLVMIQEYLTMNPASLIDLLINEFVKEEKEYGYAIQETIISKTLADGTVLNGKLVVSTYREDVTIRQILSYEARDAGMLIVTQFDKANSAESEEVIEQFWDTLEITLK